MMGVIGVMMQAMGCVALTTPSARLALTTPLAPLAPLALTTPSARPDPIRVVLGGRGYYARSFPQDRDVSEGITWANCCEALPGPYEPDFTIGVIHTGLNIDPTRSPVEPRELMRRGLDYWACGHIIKSVDPA